MPFRQTPARAKKCIVPMLQQPAGYLKSTTEKIAHISCLI
jgi:hypothetical protein